MDRADEALSIEDVRLLKKCSICPRRCGVNRFETTGVCGVGANVRIASVNLHRGEEPPISGWRGSGTVFFSGCNLGCVYCQNYPISQLLVGENISINELAGKFISLEKEGAHNINLVTPSHYVVQIRCALIIAKTMGLSVPIVYNTSGYDSPEALALMNGLVDIYLADMRYTDPKMSMLYSGVKDYPDVNRRAIKIMHRQVGNLVLDSDGIAIRGLIIRHLVLPNGVAGTESVFRFVVDEISPDTYISLMSQYFPAYKAVEITRLGKRITPDEYAEALVLMERFGLTNGWIQEMEG